MQCKIFEKDSFFTDFYVSSKQAYKTSANVDKTLWLKAFGAPKNGQIFMRLEVVGGPIIYYLEDGDQYNKIWA